MGKLFGVSQTDYGAEHLWIFTEEQLVEQTGEPVEDGYEYDYFPIGGSNCSVATVVELKSDQDIINFLTAPYGTDSADPALVDIAEYYLTIEDDDEYWGCVTGKYLKKLGLNKSELESNESVDRDYEIIEKIAEYFESIDYEDFDYDDPFYGDNSDMTVSELIELYHEVDPENTLGL